MTACRISIVISVFIASGTAAIAFVSRASCSGVMTSSSSVGGAVVGWASAAARMSPRRPARMSPGQE
ncbi:hypothetical protein [Candidatus Frankia alpina]|uniref:hypothetical protein n=1 Tax=Candidatus Frankia alpina TaxID=2699483 RepID=UPI001F2A957B|nr:hypothetical protein [Candidatus Frankia alpina]